MQKELLMKDDKIITIRKITINDIQAFFEFTKYIFNHLTDYTIDLPTEFSNDIELEKKQISKFSSSGNLLLGAFYENKLIGVLDFISNKRNRINHWGKFGISLHTDFQNFGIGTQMINMMIEWAKQNEQTNMICLSVHENNTRAIHLYKKLGFIEYGLLKNCIKNVDGRFTNSIEMFLEIE